MYENIDDQQLWHQQVTAGKLYTFEENFIPGPSRDFRFDGNSADANMSVQHDSGQVEEIFHKENFRVCHHEK